MKPAKHIRSKAPQFLTDAFSLVIIGAAVFINLLANNAQAEDSASMLIEFDDTPLSLDIILPDWFKLSFLELSNDIEELKDSDKAGIIVYFGQKNCPYCKMHLEKSWTDRGIVKYTQEHFDVIAIDVRGDRPVADTKGKVIETLRN